VQTNRCINTKDDGIVLAEKAKDADALIIGYYTPYSSIDSRTKAFLERLYPLRHVHGFMRNKPGGAIVTCAVSAEHKGLPPACDIAINAIKAFTVINFSPRNSRRRDFGLNFNSSIISFHSGRFPYNRPEYSYYPRR